MELKKGDETAPERRPQKGKKEKKDGAKVAKEGLPRPGERINRLKRWKHRTRLFGIKKGGGGKPKKALG